MKTRTLHLCVVSSLLLGCSLRLSAEEKVERTVNQCETTDDCGAQGSCVEGRCLADSGTLTSVLVEIKPAADAPEIGGVPFVQSLELPAAGGELDIDLGHLPQVTGHVTREPSEYQQYLGCDQSFVDSSGSALLRSEDGSVPARVTFTPAQRFLGISAGSSTAEAGLKDGSYQFTDKLAAGDYHVFVQPGEAEDPRCAIPPQVIWGQAIEPGDVWMPIHLPPPQRLPLTVRWPGPACAGTTGCNTLNGWIVDMVDRASGRPLSVRATIDASEATTVDGRQQASVELLWSPAIRADKTAGQELVRLSPPEGVVGPQILAERSVLEAFGTGERVMDPFETFPAQVGVEGQVSVADSPQSVPSTVTLVATELAGLNSGVLSSHVQIVETDTEGKFSVELLPGKYRVYAQPPAGSGFAATETQWAIAATPTLQAGKVIELEGLMSVAGTVVTPNGQEVLAGAPVEMQPAALVASSGLLERVLGSVPFTPRSFADETGIDGGFALQVEEGKFDFSVRPAADTGFSWFVRPNVSVGLPAKELGELPMPLPVRYTGFVSAPATGVLPGATVRVFVHQDEAGYTSDLTQAASVLQIAEAQADENGEYELLLPSRL